MAEMAEIAAVTVKVVPDFSLFRQPAQHEIVAAIAADLPSITIGDLQTVADVVLQHFTVFPK